ncbi:MAG: PAS domain S-box protein, partial [Deltaproteobacteria bacterium]|nr:PAS domain S-box protein [Deltaproteobacteria bacterium]
MAKKPTYEELEKRVVELESRILMHKTNEMDSIARLKKKEVIEKGGLPEERETIPMPADVPDNLVSIFSSAHNSVRSYFENRIENPTKATIEISGERYLLVRAASMSKELFDLVTSMYMDRGEKEAREIAFGFMFDLAHSLGKADAKAFHAKMGITDPNEKLSVGPIHFAYSGWAFVKILPESKPTTNEDFYLIYDHPFSFEAHSWKKQGKKTKFPVCIMNAGYSSGWCEESYGIPLVSVEIECQAKGDKRCRFIMASPSKIEQYLARHRKTTYVKGPDSGIFSIPEFFQRKRLEDELRKSKETSKALLNASDDRALLLDKEGTILDKFRKLYDESKRSEEVYRSLLHTSADAIVIYDMEGMTRYINTSFKEIFGWSLEELKNKRVPFLPDSEREKTMAIILELIENGTPCHGYETKRFTKDGRLLDISISASRYLDHEGKPAGMLVILRNISERKKLESQFQAAQRMESVGTLAGGIAHDFNNLLMGIMGNASLILLDTKPEHSHYDKLKNIEKYVQNGADLTKQLLGFARGGKYEVKTTDLNDIIEKSSQMFGRAKKEIEINRKYQKNIWTVEVDQGQIEQVLLNLYVNAWQAMSGGGKLFIQTENVFLEDAYVRPYNIMPGKYVKISIVDTGVGMDKKIQDRIFDPFFTTKEISRGTGLGLASAYGIIKNHGGIINLYSERGRGTTFNIYLPGSEKAPLSEKEPISEITRGSETIMLVDDEEMIIDIGKQLLERFGYKVLVARDGREAENVYRKNKDSID